MGSSLFRLIEAAEYFGNRYPLSSSRKSESSRWPRSPFLRRSPSYFSVSIPLPLSRFERSKGYWN